MNNLAVFAFNSKQVRIIDIEGNPWFVGIDICEILELGNPRQAYTRLRDYEKNTVTINDGIPGNPNTVCISESGLYRLILTSRKPQAEPFQDWVCQEILPSIRKYGRFESQPKPARQLPPVHSVVEYANTYQYLETSTMPAALKQLLIDKMGDELATVNNTQLNQTRWVGVAQKAEEMNYKVNASNRGKLGKFVKAQGLGFKSEERLCNGQLRRINVYEDLPELEQSIHLFFS
jgi:prophage antirepressor-like protein